MFIPKTERIKLFFQTKPAVISELETLLSGKTNIYIDYANVKPWSEKLGWHVDEKRLKQFLDSFDNISVIKFYAGELNGDPVSQNFIADIKRLGYVLRTKPVKIMKHSVDFSSISIQSTNLINHFVRACLVRKFDIAAVEFINRKFEEMNKKGEYYIEDRKCNFDVEIASDMIIDNKQDSIETFVLWSGDSDFADTVEQLLGQGKKVIIFATARRVSKELNDLRVKGLLIFEINKIKEFICWKREIVV
jgi:uncharacterized LabA/DUF88 family protein